VLSVNQQRAATIERLLQEGLDLFHAGMADHAVAAWTEVLHMQPDEPRALEYLRQAGAGHGSDEEPVVQPGASVRAELEQLLAERRYEEALELLYAARQKAPDAADISRGIQLIKQRLIKRYLHQIGTLDQVPTVALTPAQLDSGAVSDDEHELIRLADGIASFGDIARETRFGRFETYRLLASLLGRGVLAVPGTTPETIAALAQDSVSPVTAPAPPRRTTTWLVGAVFTVAAAGIAVALWQVGPWSRAGTADAAPTAAVVPAPRPATPEPAPAEVAVAVAVGVALDATPAAEPATPGPPGREEPVVEVQPTPPARKTPPPAHPPARPTRAAVAREPPPAPVPPEPAAPETAAPAHEPAPAPPPAPPAPATPPPQQPPPARPGPLDAEATTSGLTVQGALTRGVVERALARIVHNFRACYATAALRAERNAASNVQVAMMLDETGTARDATASGGTLPGLDECVREAARRLHTEAPDVGVVHVNFTVTYRPIGP
jgi:hypothetical protein